MDTETLILEYLKVILTAPTVIGVLGTIFLLLFKNELRSLINRIASLKIGSAELTAPQLPPPADQTAQGQLPNPAPPQLPPGESVPPQETRLVEQAPAAERARADLWEYRYLNYFLGYATQRVLDWLASVAAPVTVAVYVSYLQAF